MCEVHPPDSFLSADRGERSVEPIDEMSLRVQSGSDVRGDYLIIEYTWKSSVNLKFLELYFGNSNSNKCIIFVVKIMINNDLFLRKYVLRI